VGDLSEQPQSAHLPHHVRWHQALGARSLVAIALSIAAGILFAILPARQVWSIDVIQAIKSGYVFAGSFRCFAVRDVLLLIQIVDCSLLVTASLVAVRGMMRLLHVPLGMEPAALLRDS
jgi:hypothetical protein